MWINVLVLIVTVILTTLILLGFRWIERSKEKYPEVYKNRYVFRAVLYILFNSTDL
jgi:hypothetical protein